MAQQDIRYYLNGLLMVVEDDQLKLIATDGTGLRLRRRKVAETESVSSGSHSSAEKTVLELSKTARRR